MSFNEFADRSKIIVFKCFENTHETISDFISKHADKTYIFEHCIDHMYTGYNLNTNHFHTSYHISTILPKISEILGIPYNQHEFITIMYKDGQFELPYLYPIRDTGTYEIITDNVHQKGNYSILLNVNRNDSHCPSRYHSLFRGYHKNTRIFNSAAVTDKKLIICCDSEMIPIMPVLAYYFKEIIHLDNRSSRYSLKNWVRSFDGYECMLAMLNLNISGIDQFKKSIEK